MGMELLFPSNQGNIAEEAVFPLLVEGGENGTLVGFGLTQPLPCQHILSTKTEIEVTLVRQSVNTMLQTLS